MSKKLKGLLLALVLCLQVVVPAAKADAATVLYNNATGYEGNYAYELWKDYGSTSMTLKGNGLFECWWENIGNALFRKGVKWDCTQTYSQLGNITVTYGVDYQPNGNSYLCVYGWCRNPLVEYYIVDSWGTWRPPGATSKGTITVDGGTYDVYETTRVNQPSIDGNTTFQQYWSVRTSKRTSGTISVTEHFKAWERMGMQMGKMYEAALTVEGYQSSGWADVYQLDITVGGSGGSSSGGSSSGSGDSASSAPGTNKGTEIECESMTKSGQYTGNITSPFDGVALYGNDDAVSTTVNFTSGTHDFSLRGASNNSELAQADLYVGGEKKGTFYFGDANTAEYTIQNVSTGTGNKKVEIKMSADDGNWDLYADCLIIGGDGVSTGSGSQGGGNSGNQGSNSGNQGGNTSGGNTGSGTTNTGATMECEDMTKSGQYTGKISSPFNGVALYANDDAVSYTQNFTSSTNTFTLTGASNNDNMARVDLFIDGQNKGTFYYGDANVADFVIENVSTGTGNKKVELKVTADDGQWDAYIDKLTINGGATSGGNTGDSGNTGNQGGNTGNNSGNTGNNNGNTGNNQGGNTSGGTTNTGATMECEDMTKSGQYTGNVSSPFSGVALYANNDAVSYTQNFTGATNTFTLTGASNNDNMAQVDLYIDNEKKGTFYYGDANVADFVIENVTTGTGNKTVKLVVSADDGQWDAYIDKLTISGGATSGGNTGDSGNQGGNTGSDSGNTGNNSGNTGNNGGSSDSSATVKQCEDMTKSGQYTGNVSSPFNGVALYANNDAVSYTQYFANGTHDFTLRGASNGDNMARVDLVIGNETKGTFYFGDANIAEYTISNVSHGTGNQEVKLVVTADDGQWDAYIDSLTISAAGSVSTGNGGNAGGGNNSGNSGNQGSSSAVTIETTTPSQLLTTNWNVQYGQIKKTQYWSNTCEKYRNVIVLLPPNYDSSKQYPVMYALHGLNQDETFLIGDGSSGFRIMLGNMINQGLAKDMIVVFPYIFASKTMDYCTGFDQQSFAAYDNFINELTNDLMPYIKRTYSVAEGRENTAIIGFSMGGRESLYIGYKLQNQIGYVGAIAPAPGLTPGNDFSGMHAGMISESEFKFAQDPKVLMICCGTADSVVGTFPKSYHDILTRNGESHYWWEIQGSDHGDPAITNGLYNFCKAIFK